MEKDIKKIYLRPFKMKLAHDNFLALVLKRDVTLREAKYILGNILKFVLQTREEMEAWEYEEYNKDIQRDVNDWLRGKFEDTRLMEDYAWDCAGEPLGAMYIVPILVYLQKRNVL